MVKIVNRMDIFGTVSARVWYAFDSFMHYVTGGLAVAHVQNTWTEEDDPEDSWFDYGGTRAGWTLGARVEFALYDH